MRKCLLHFVFLDTSITFATHVFAVDMDDSRSISLIQIRKLQPTNLGHLSRVACVLFCAGEVRNGTYSRELFATTKTLSCSRMTKPKGRSWNVTSSTTLQLLIFFHWLQAWFLSLQRQCGYFLSWRVKFRYPTTTLLWIIFLEKYFEKI